MTWIIRAGDAEQAVLEIDELAGQVEGRICRPPSPVTLQRQAKPERRRLQWSGRSPSRTKCAPAGKARIACGSASSASRSASPSRP
ncbi:MAG TPA: hypothetical protein VFW19_16910 [Allosphingosinicella sp.]|nr:hypothetical protein [Allosphingosinicella sp.]